MAVGDAGFKQDVVALSLDSDFCLIVLTGSAQIWAGAQHRIRLGHLERCEESLKVEGLNKRAYWCSSRRLLAVLVNMLSILHAEHTYLQILVKPPANNRYQAA